MSRQLTTALLVTALLGVSLSALPAVAATTEPEPTRAESIDELDLDGVDAAAAAELPEIAPEPAETQLGVSATQDLLPADEPMAGDAPAPDVLTTELDTQLFSVLGVTWDAGPQDAVIRYRVRQAGEWTAWEAVAAGDVAPDAGLADDSPTDARAAADPIVAMDADGLQLWAESETAEVTGLKAVLIDPGVQAGDDAASVAAAAVPVPGQPAIISRAGWGADESLRACPPEYSAQMLSAAVHHTASTNSYGPDDVPALLRGFYAYHTRPEAEGGRGWCDIGYNFLVDRFGRLFEGRAGGITATVIGVHTGGFNSRTIGIAAIGDFSSVAVPDALTEALASLIAWKFSIHGISANTDVTMISGGGASKFPAGTAVTFSTIYGHRDAQLTSCPGQNLYNLLPYLRNRVAELANASVGASPRGVWDSVTTTATSLTVAGWAFDPETADPIVVEVRVDGVLSTVLADKNRPDIGALYPAVGPRHGFSLKIPHAAGTVVVCLAAANVLNGTTVSLGCRTVTIRNQAPIGSVDALVVTRTGVVVTGWVLDPDTSSSTQVHIYVDGVGTPLTADQPRPDIGAVFGKGSAHGFTFTKALAAGDHEMCAYSIDSAGGANTVLLCRPFTVRARPASGLWPMLDVVHAVPGGGMNLWEVSLASADPARGKPLLTGTLGTGGFSYADSRTTTGRFGNVTGRDDGSPDRLVAHRQPGGGVLLWVVGGGPDSTPRVWGDLRGGGWSWADSEQLVGDVNGDKLDDVVSVHRSPVGGGVGTNVWAHLNTGSGFAAPALWATIAPTGAPGGDVPASSIPFRDSRYLLGDTDGDGRADLVTVHRSRPGTSAITYAVWRSTGAGLAAPAGTTSADRAGGWRFDLSRDLLANVDGRAGKELVTVHHQPGDGVLLWSRALGSGRFGAPTMRADLRTGGWSWTGSRQSAADVDGDGDDDIVTVHAQPTLGELVWVHPSGPAGTQAPVLVADLRSGGWSYSASRESIGLLR
ncbi:N-acetylmuramoyl-L-alanine amidase [Cellulomonas sp. P5_C5]